MARRVDVAVASSKAAMRRRRTSRDGAATAAREEKGFPTMHVQRTGVTTAFSRGETVLAAAVHRAGQPG